MSWRNWAVLAGAAIVACGLVLYRLFGTPVVLIVGLLAVLTAILEPIYGRPRGRPIGEQWERTDERFVDPESGALVTVWFNPRTGERRYVENVEANSPRT